MFLNLVMLAGLGGAAVPLVLHLLARARYRDVEWGAMMFLEGADVRQSQSARLKQWALLGLRMLMVGLLATALARPVVRGRWSGLGPEGRITAVIVLDRSYSMGFEEAGRSRFDKAKDAALQVLAGLRKGDEAALVLLGEQVEVRPPTSNLHAVARDVTEMQVSGGASDLEQALAAARSVLDQPARINRELYIITDRQASAWRRVGDGARHKKWMNQPGSPTRFYVVPVGGEDTENVAVEAVELAHSVAIKGQPTEVEVRVRNYAPAPRVGMDLSLSVTGPGEGPRRLKTVPVTVAAKSSTTLRIPATFDRVGSHVLTAQIQASGLEADNRFASVIDVIDPIQVLLVSGDEPAKEMRRESFFLRLAIAPYQTAQKRAGDPAVLTIKGSEDWFAAGLGKYQVVILANVPQITPEQARALEQKVYEGAGLIIAPGNLCRLENYNTILHRDGLGLLPSRLENPTPADGSEATSLGSLDLSHAVFRFARDLESLPNAVVTRCFPTSARPGDARVIGSYGSGRPFVIDAPRGRGRVLLISTPLDADWGTLPLSAFYLPFVQSIVRYAAAAPLPARNLAPGEPIIASFDEPVEEARLWRNDERLPNPPLFAGRTEIREEQTQRPGVYRLRVRWRSAAPERIYHYVVQSPRSESDLRPMTSQQWRNTERAMGFARLDAEDGSMSTRLARDRGGQEIWLALLVAAMVAGVGELWLARLWSKEAA